MHGTICYTYLMENPFAPERAIIHTKELPEFSLEKAFNDYLGRHIIDVKPERVGNKQSTGQLRGSAFGCVDVSIDRCAPKLKISQLALNRGKSMVLIGPNGSGKSTVFDAIMRQDTAGYSAISDDCGYVYGESVHGKDKLRISRLQQEELLGALVKQPVQSVLDYAQEYFSKQFPVDWSDPDAFDTNILHQESLQRIEELRTRLEQLFGIKDFLERNVSDLSGGESTKLSLCMTLLSEPDILLLDEPTNHLDIESIAKLSALIDIYTRAGVSVLSVSHVNDFLAGAGKDGVLDINVSTKERSLITSNAPYFNYIKDRSRESQGITGDISWKSQPKKQSGALIQPNAERITIPQSPLIDIDTPSLLPNEVWVLSGSNGTGKTRLMEQYVSQDPKAKMVRAKGVTLGYLPQFWSKEVERFTLEDFFEWAKYQMNPHDTEAKIHHLIDAIQEIGFVSANKDANAKVALKKRLITSFSGGEQRLLWFLIASRMPHLDALFLDEPTNHMDKQLQGVVTKAIQSFQGAVVLSTHDLQLLDSLEKSVGNKGSTQAMTTIALQKRDGKTTIQRTSVSPARYMREQIARASKSVKGKMGAK